MAQVDTKQVGTRDQILRLAAHYLQRYGFNNLSFQMIADELGIRKPSLYHHFASKEELGLMVLKQYTDLFVIWREKVKDQNPLVKMQLYFKIYENFSADDSKLCPVGALSIDINSLPNSMKKAMRVLYGIQADWVQQTLQEGVKQKFFKTSLSSQGLTDLVMSTLQGALLLARVHQNQSIFTGVRKNLEILLGGKNALLARAHKNS